MITQGGYTLYTRTTQQQHGDQHIDYHAAALLRVNVWAKRV